MVLRTGKEFLGIYNQPSESCLYDQELENLEALPLPKLQEELVNFIWTRLSDSILREKTAATLHKAQNQSLHLEDPHTHQITHHINIALSPIVIGENLERGLRTYTQTTNLVRAATLMLLEENEHLRDFFEAGVDPLTREIMKKHPFKPAVCQWRFRADTLADLSGKIKGLENNGGEPQGDIIVSDAVRVMEEILRQILNLPEEVNISLASYPDEQMMKVIIKRYREATGKKDIPNIGFLCWRERSSLSRLEAKYTAARYEKKYGKKGIVLDPREIVDIEKHEGADGAKYYVLVSKDQEGQKQRIHILRRLHGEPMENMDLWNNFKKQAEQTMCSDGEQTIWERFMSLQNQMINPLNSFSTDKKLDVILGNPDFLEHFKIWRKVEQILEDDQLRKAFFIPSSLAKLGIDNIKRILLETVPRAYMLRRKKDGLYDGDQQGQELCLSEDEIQNIIKNRKKWVLKRKTLEGHSGTNIHVGRGINLYELDIEDYLLMPEEDVRELTGLSKKELQNAWDNGVFRQDSIMGRAFIPKDSDKTLAELAQMHIRNTIKNRVKKIKPSLIEKLSDFAWEALIKTSLNEPDSLIQQALEQPSINSLVLTTQDKVIKVRVNYDVDPQSIGPTVYTFPVIRVSSPDQSKTNITGGYGGLGVAISEKMARRILAFAKVRKLY